MIREVRTPPTTRARAILHHPDQTSAWSVVVVASLTDALEPGVLTQRLARLADVVPSVGARLVDDGWVAGSPPTPVVLDGEPLSVPLLTARYALASEPPLRIAVGQDGRRLAVAAHHAAFDGLGLVAILGALVGEPMPDNNDRPDLATRSAGFGAGGLLNRVVHPADRVAPSNPSPSRECFASRDVAVSGPGFTAKLAEASVRAVAVRNGRLHQPWERIALSIGVGGHAGVGNLASYRRVELQPDGDVTSAVATALNDPTEPGELSWAPKAARLLRPLAARLSDSLLISNVGRHPLPGVSRLEFFPVARGRSAVAIGAAGVTEGRATVTVRARWLSQDDCEQLLADAAGML